MGEIDFYNPEYYTNRELSWILFDHRVLNEARDKSILLFERLKFLSITASNLDEFFMIRVASLWDMVHARYQKPDIAGLTPKEQLDRLSVAIHELVDLQYSTYNRSLVPKLKANGLVIVGRHEELTKKERVFVDKYFEENVYPVLTPMAVGFLQAFSADQEQDPEHRGPGAQERDRRGAGICHGTGTRCAQPYCGTSGGRRGTEGHSSGRDHRAEYA